MHWNKKGGIEVKCLVFRKKVEKSSETTMKTSLATQN